MKAKTALLFTIVLACHAPVMAGEDAKPWYRNGSFYASLSGGVAVFGDGSVDVDNNPSGAADFDFDTGSSVALRLGADFGSLRLEGEYGYTRADISSLATNTGGVDVDSRFTGSGFMANAIWDYDYKPFVFSAGLGVGLNRIKFDQMENSGFVAAAECEDTVFSGQLILGVSYNLNERTLVGMSYRHTMVSDSQDKGYVDTGGSGESIISYDSFEAGIFELFVTWRF